MPLSNSLNQVIDLICNMYINVICILQVSSQYVIGYLVISLEKK